MIMGKKQHIIIVVAEGDFEGSGPEPFQKEY